MQPSTLFRSGVLAALSYTAIAMAQTPCGFSPSSNKRLDISFGDEKVTPGSAVTLTDTASPPSVGIPAAKSCGAAHVVMVVDLDAPGGITNQSFSPLLHWLVSVPPGQLSSMENNAKISTIASWVQPGPAAGQGPHRYVALAFEAPGSEFSVPSSFENLNFTNIEDRLIFDVTKFADEAQLKTVAGNWFTTEFV